MLFAPCSAQIYRYEDEQGWHFTDKPPPDVECEIVDIQCEPEQRLPEDLTTYLSEKAEVHTELERASVGVVMVEGKFAFGSGFFISTNGHILTNRHVVRPIEPWQIGYILDEIQAHKAAFERAKKLLDRWALALESAKLQLDSWRRHVASKPRDPVASESLKAYEKDYRQALKSYRDAKRAYVRRKREFDNARWDFTLRASAALVATNFVVTLDDNSKLPAKLIAIAKDWDLALLKVDGHTTPMLTASTAKPHKGEPITVIGSPRALQNAMTSGIISEMNEDAIMTDAQIWAGSSGGPVVNADGEVLGVTTAQLTVQDEAGAFAFAIPIDDAKAFWTEAIDRK
jgi:hypothetical protein